MCPGRGFEAMGRFSRICKDERGATAVEYGLILGLIFLAMVGAVSQFASTTINMWTMIEEKVSES
jgi:pilus assembly protein Flp/PilA